MKKNYKNLNRKCDRNFPTPKTPPCKGMIEFPAFNGAKKKPEPRLKGIGG